MKKMGKDNICGNSKFEPNFNLFKVLYCAFKWQAWQAADVITIHLSRDKFLTCAITQKKRKLYAILLTLSSINVKKNELLEAEKNANFSAFSLQHELHT